MDLSTVAANRVTQVCRGGASRGSRAASLCTFIGMAAYLLVGCTMIPKYQRPAAPVAASFPGVSEPTTASAADIQWRQLFTDERLIRLIELALINNRDLKVAVLNVEQSRAQYRITRSSSYPTLEASGSYSRQRTGDLTTELTSVGIGVSAYELDIFGRVRSLNQQALEQYLATEQAQRSAQIALVAEVATQYFSLREAHEQVALARRTLATVQESYDLNKILFDSGSIRELDFRIAEGQLQTARINVITSEQQAAQAQNALVLLLGSPLPSDLPSARPFDDSGMLAEIPVGLPSVLVARRPDILQAEHTLKAANANIGAARAAFFPTISLTASAGRSSVQLSQLFGAGTGTWSFMPQISVPLFTGGRNSANLEAAKVGERIEVANYEKSIQTAFREVADALAANASYADQVAAQSHAIEAQSRRFELAMLRYRQGEDTYLNALLAQQDLYSAQLGRLQAQFNHLSSQISLYQALGGGWTND
jgi:multidrug efflux system outer membrane protein